MAKTESTAVNDLIELVQSGQSQPVHDPDADLFATPKPPATPTRAARMTSPVPALRGAGEVEPLPRGRAPQSTSQQAMATQGAPMLPMQVRMSTAELSSGNTIPPLPARASSPAMPPPRKTPRATTSVPALPPTRASGSDAAPRPTAPPPHPSAPPPHPSTTASARPSAPPARASTPPPRPSQRPTPVSPPVPQRASSPRPSSLMNRPTVPTLPPPIAPVAAPFEARVDNPFVPPAVPPQAPVVARSQTSDPAADVVRADARFETPGFVRKVATSTTSTHVVPRPSFDTLSLARKLILPSILAAIIGVAIGGYIAFGREGAKTKRSSTAAATAPVASPETRIAMTATASPAAATDETRVAMTATPTAAAPGTESSNAATASAGAAQPEPPTKQEDLAKQQAAAAVEAAQAPAAAAPAAGAVPATAVREVQTPRGVVKLVDVRIDSKPAGATVMLVDGGKTSFLGSTPLATSVDASRTYDVIFTLPGRPTQMAPLDPATTTHLDVALARASRSSSGSSGSSGSSAKKSAKLDAFIDTSVEAAKPAAADKPAKAEKAAKADSTSDDAKASDAKAGGEGTLMVSSKPPCEILIDGKATGLTTPQRSIPLPAGAHKVTFVNTGAGINKTVSVSITADKSTKLIQDLMNN